MTAPSPTPTEPNAGDLRAGVTAELCARLVALHGPLVRATCHRILRDEALSEDAAQETFILLIRKAATLPPHTPLAGWLYHAACRTALNHLRTALRRHARESTPEARANLAPETREDRWEELAPHVDAAMLTLPTRQRDLVVQCYFQNQSQREAARAHGCSESVVSRELRAAIETLRRLLAQRGSDLGSGALIAAISAYAARGVGLAGSGKLIGAMLAAWSGHGAGAVLALIAAGLHTTTVKVAALVLALLALGIAGRELAWKDLRVSKSWNHHGPIARASALDRQVQPAQPPKAPAPEAAALLAAVPRFETIGAFDAAMLEAILCRNARRGTIPTFRRLHRLLSRDVRRPPPFSPGEGAIAGKRRSADASEAPRRAGSPQDRSRRRAHDRAGPRG